MPYMPSRETIQRETEYARKEKQERLRETFAAAALTGWLASQQTVISQAEMAKRAYDYADAMLRERERTNHNAVPEACDQLRAELTGAKRGGRTWAASHRQYTQ